MISRRITFSALFILILVASLFAGLTSCSDVLLQKESTDFALSFVAPGASSGRAADGAAHWNVTAWLELEDGTTLQSQQTAAKAGDPVAIAFAPVAAGTRLKVKVELLSAQPPLQKYAGESEFMEVLPGEKTVRLELKLVDAELEEPVIDNADTPTITAQPVGETKTFAAGKATEVTKELTVKASVSDGGTLTYQWYSNTSNSTTDGTRIEGATSSSYEATVNAKETKYFYCIVTNTNNNVTADIITSVVAVASVEGELASITAKYTGSQGYMLVGQINHNDFTVTETYTSGTERVDVTVTPNENSYSIDATNGDSAEAIGQVPYTVTRIGTNVTTTAVVPIKYELDVNNLTITGGDTVEQDGNLVLTAEYKVNGNDSYNLYISPDSSSSYKIIENVLIIWTGAEQKDNAWEANAKTGTVGSQTATVKLSTRDEWCITTNSIEKSHQYTVNAAIPESGLSYNQASKALTIYNEQGLKNFRDIVNGTLSSDLNVDGQTYNANTENATISATLANDITLTEAWVPIGKSSSNLYTGIFDGNQHTVSGIAIDNSNENPMGLFGAVGSGGTVKNLVVEGTISSSYYAGGIAGYIDGATIEYCVNKINITNKGSGNKGFTGGIAGYVSSTQSTVTGCVNMGTISGVEMVGGILGSSNSTKGATVDKCINIGSITTAGGTTGECGGIYGSPETIDDAITNCLNLGSITSDQNKAAGITSNSGVNMRITVCLSAGDMSQAQAGSQPLAFYLQTNDTSLNYYDSDKISSTASSIVGTPKTTTELKVATAFGDSWSEWSFADDRYPVPNIQTKIPAAIWDAIVAKARN